MDGVQERVVLGTLPELAKKAAEWFPEFNGRSLAVSEMDMDRDIKPTLPIILVSLLKEGATHHPKTQHVQIEQVIILEFWVPPSRYKTESGGESPFWAYYDFESVRDRALSQVMGWVSPRGARLEYDGLTVDCSEYAVQICMTLKHKYEFCRILPEAETVTIKFNFAQSNDNCCEEPCLEQKSGCVENCP